MPLLTPVTLESNIGHLIPPVYAGVMWSSAPVKVVINVTPGATITITTQTAGLPVNLNFTEDVPGSGIWSSYVDNIGASVFGNPGTYTNCFNFVVSDTPLITDNFCFNVTVLPNPYKEIVLTVNGGPVSGTYSTVNNGFQNNQMNGTAIVNIPAGGIVRLMNNINDPPYNLELGGTTYASVTIQKID